MELSLKEFKEYLALYYRQRSAANIEREVLTKLQPYRVDNAIIMAAGKSTRFSPFSLYKPKALAQVKGELLIERQIQQLQAVGIPDIYVVVGYKKEQFLYLAEKFGVHIVENDDYDRYNNTATLMCVRQYLANSYICSSDNYFTKNPFEPYVYRPYYAAVYADGETAEWCLAYDAQERITAVTIGGRDSWYMLGHAYFDKAFSRTFLQILQNAYKDITVREHLWEDLYRQHLDELVLYIRKYPADVIYEFDSLAELAAFDPQSTALEAKYYI